MTTSIYQRFRRDVGLDPDDDATLSDAAIDDLIEEAGETYSGAAASAYARVLYLIGRRGMYSEETSYRIAETQESAGEAFDNLGDLLAFWERRVQLAAAGAGIGAVSVFAVAHGTRGR